MVPDFEAERSLENYIFAFEELENNLHPALLRRLFTYLENFAVQNNTTIFLTTHSNVALDIFGMSENATITRVEHDGESAYTKTVTTHFDRYAVVSELGLKPSDLLQANGIIWVEGPSDRIYLNKWIDLFSNGELQEGRDYQCAFYGGALLGRSQFVDPDEADEREFTNLLWVNPRVIVVADGDRTAASGEGSGMKHRLVRVKQEVEKLPDGHIWITKAKEIENYLPGEILSELFNKPNLPSPGQYDYFFPTEGSKGQSYLLRKAKRKTVDKTDMALSAVSHMTVENLMDRFDLEVEVKVIIERIRGWNA